MVERKLRSSLILMGVIVALIAAGVTLVVIEQGTSGPSGPVSSLSCSTSTSCIALGFDRDGNYSLTSSNGGTTWEAGGTLAGEAGIGVVLCIGRTHCLAAGTVNPGLVSSTNDGGQQWSVAIDGFVSFGLACPSENLCLSPGFFRVGQPIVERTTDGGGTWTPVVLPTTRVPTTVWCSTPEDCFVSAGGSPLSLFISRDGGQTWVQSPSSIGAESVLRAECPAAGHCILVGRYIFTTLDNGAAWTRFPFTSNWFGAFITVTCADPMHCLAAGGGDLVSTSDGGTTWALRSLTGLESPSITGLTCQPGTQTCLASGVEDGGGVSGFIERSDNAGRSWTLVDHG